MYELTCDPSRGFKYLKGRIKAQVGKGSHMYIRKLKTSVHLRLRLARICVHLMKFARNLAQLVTNLIFFLYFIVKSRHVCRQHSIDYSTTYMYFGLVQSRL